MALMLLIPSVRGQSNGPQATTLTLGSGHITAAHARQDLEGMAPAVCTGEQHVISCRARLVHKVTLKAHTCSPLKQSELPSVVFTSPYSSPN